MARHPSIPTHARPHAGRAFSLIELVAVIVIVSILAVTAAPVVSSLAGVRRSVAARHLLRDLAFARQYAVATGTGTWVVIDAPDRWSVLVEDPSSPGRAGAGPMSDSGRPMVVELGVNDYAGVQIDSAVFDAGAEIGFDYLGRPLTGDDEFLVAQGVVTLTGDRRVLVEPVTGLAWVVLP
jgi:prepilin-type N-terminal cleavage/methylation domain-containing protein